MTVYDVQFEDSDGGERWGKLFSDKEKALQFAIDTIVAEVATWGYTDEENEEFGLTPERIAEDVRKWWSWEDQCNFYVDISCREVE